MKLLFTYLIIILSVFCKAQNTDSINYVKLQNQFLPYKNLCTSDLVLKIANSFIGTPYVGHVLDQNQEEQLVVDFAKLDCVTFVENVIAFARTIREKNPSYTKFRDNLTLIRYKEGKINGYSSRLHYASDWIFDNGKKQIIEDKTKQYNYSNQKKIINFMSAHRNLYKELQNSDIQYNKILQIEKSINQRNNYIYIRKQDLKDVRISSGSVIFIASSVVGLDYAHCGLIKNINNKSYLIHASSKNKKVEITQTTLYEYLMANNNFNGIVVLEIL